MAILLITLLTSCVSNTVYKTIVPDLDFPTFPLADVMTDNGNGTTAVDNGWIIRLAEFYIRYSETESDYKEIKELYEDN